MDAAPGVGSSGERGAGPSREFFSGRTRTRGVPSIPPSGCQTCALAASRHSRPRRSRPRTCRRPHTAASTAETSQLGGRAPTHHVRIPERIVSAVSCSGVSGCSSLLFPQGSVPGYLGSRISGFRGDPFRSVRVPWCLEILPLSPSCEGTEPARTGREVQIANRLQCWWQPTQSPPRLKPISMAVLNLEDLNGYWLPTALIDSANYQVQAE